jgi:hypothetical protein
VDILPDWGSKKCLLISRVKNKVYIFAAYSFQLFHMKKILSLLITFTGIIIVAGGFIFTPAHSFNAVDSNSGLSASAGLVFGGLIVFGGGLIWYMSTLPYAGEKK